MQQLGRIELELTFNVDRRDDEKVLKESPNSPYTGANVVEHKKVVLDADAADMR